MNEDGSFIGQYGRKGRGQDTNSQAFATLVQMINKNNTNDFHCQ